MNENCKVFDELLREHRIRLKRSALFDTEPGALSDTFSFDKVEGMMLGLAVGDALGNRTEGVLPKYRRVEYDEIRDYLPNRENGERTGLPSDDTQLAFWTIEQMLKDGGFNPESVAARFCQGRIFGVGSSVRKFIDNHHSGMPWYMCGPKSIGNGALMRIAPMVIPHLRSPSPDLWVDTALCAMITHNDSPSIAACLALIKILWEAMSFTSTPDPGWWLETYTDTARDLEEGDKYRPRGGRFKSYEGPVWQFVHEKVKAAYGTSFSVAELCDSWQSGAYLLETIPCVMLILMRHGDNFEEAVVRAVNDTKDSDSIAAIVGAAVGALHGKAAIPDRWLAGLSGRTAKDDNGRVFELLRKSKEAWWTV